MRKYKIQECSHCGNEKPIAAKGLCRSCYSRLARNGDFEKRKIKNVCKIEDCEKFVVTQGLCDKHRQRLVKHGHTEQTRPNDWGDREKHPLYNVWSGHRRYKSTQELTQVWHCNFWDFVAGVGDRPSSDHYLRPIDFRHPIGPDNFHWVKSSIANLKTEDQKAYLRAWAREDRKNNPDKYKDKSLLRHFGITLDQYNEMINEQDYKCKICKNSETALNPRTKEPRDLAVDHCHNTGKVRGLLCSRCNTALGSFKDDVSLLKQAIVYLSRN